MNTNDLYLRPIKSSDLPFLSKLYASTREEELAVLDWSDEQKAAFLQMQFEAQHQFYQEQFPNSAFDVISLNGKPIGRLYVDHREDEIRIVDIALLPRYRQRGVGSHYLHRILGEGETAQLPVKIHVEHNNPALQLYIKLGFQHVDDTGVYYLMVWTPQVEEPAYA